MKKENHMKKKIVFLATNISYILEKHTRFDDKKTTTIVEVGKKKNESRS